MENKPRTSMEAANLISIMSCLDDKKMYMDATEENKDYFNNEVCPSFELWAANIIEAQRRQAAEQARIETARQLMATGWFPMEMAPKDGSLFYSYNATKKSIELIFWDEKSFENEGYGWIYLLGSHIGAVDSDFTHYLPRDFNPGQPSEILKLAVAAHKALAACHWTEQEFSRHVSGEVLDSVDKWDSDGLINEYVKLLQASSPETRSLLESVALGMNPGCDIGIPISDAKPEQ